MRCAVLDDYQNVAFSYADWGRFEGLATFECFDRHLSESELVQALGEFDILVAMRERTVFNRRLLEQLPNLKLLVTTGMANASIDIYAASQLGITVAGTRGTVGPAAELAWALLLAVARHIPSEVNNLRTGGSQWQLSVGYDLKGKTLGVAGLGKLGQIVANYGRAFGMTVLGWSRSNTPENGAALGIGYADSLASLLKAADVVSLHLPLTPETTGLLGTHEFSLMKPGAILINTSRGALVDEQALIEALKQGQLYGAGLDVFHQEPLPVDHPFRTLPNVVATPHIGYVTDQTYRIFFSDVVENITEWISGKPVRLLNDPGERSAIQR